MKPTHVLTLLIEAEAVNQHLEVEQELSGRLKAIAHHVRVGQAGADSGRIKPFLAVLLACCLE